MNRAVKQEYRSLRARIIRKGTTLRTWALHHGYPVTTVYGAARGERAGVKATRIHQQLYKEFGA